MASTTADFLLERLHENGVGLIYGYPGDGINAIVGCTANRVVMRKTPLARGFAVVPTCGCKAHTGFEPVPPP